MKFKKLKPYQLMEKGDTNTLELKSDIFHEFNSIHIDEGCTLSVKPWLGRKTYFDPYKLDALVRYWSNHTVLSYSMDVQQLILKYYSKNIDECFGGRLLIKCAGDIIIEKGGKIKVDSCGYKSGQYHGAGESWYDTGKYDRSPNVGGGGAGLEGGYGGGGGGYGTKGGDGYIPNNHNNDNDQHQNGIGGDVYGDKYLTTLFLGSGGGGGSSNLGGDGGGAIYIECQKLINYGSITANGGDSDVGAGAGSGGSIYLIIHDSIIMNKESLIQAKGGYGGKWGLYANGGHGRIRIDINKNYQKHIDDILKLKRIHPPPFIYAEHK